MTATGAVEPFGFAAQARAMVSHSCGAPRPGCDLTALDPIRPRLSRDHHRQDCDCVKKLEFRHAFSISVADPYARYLITRLAFEARYSGARQYIFRIKITVTRSGIWIRVWVALQAMILGSGVAELAYTGNRHDFRYGSRGPLE